MRTRILIIHWALNPKIDVARIYLPRKKGGRELINVEDTVKLTILELQRYVLTSEEGLLIKAGQVDRDYEQHLGMTGSVKEFQEMRRNELSDVLKQKKLQG